MAVFTGILYTDPPVDLAKLANDGRITLVSATEIKWDGSVIGLSDGTNWKVCKPSSIPTAANTATDLNGTALAVDKIYDVFLNYSSVTSAALAFSRWAAHTAGSSSRNAAYAAGTPYIIGDRVTYSGRDYTCIQAGTGKTPTSEPTYWVDNGTSVSGDYHGLYRHDGVLVSHNSDAGKKLRWLGNIYTYNNSSVVNFKDEVTSRYISNFYNSIIKTVKTYCALGSSYTYTTATAREVPSQVKGYFVACKTNTAVFTGMYQVDAAGTAPMLTYLYHNNSSKSITSVMRIYEAGICLAEISPTPGINWISQYEYGGVNTPSILGFSNRITANIAIGF